MKLPVDFIRKTFLHHLIVKYIFSENIGNVKVFSHVLFLSSRQQIPRKGIPAANDKNPILICIILYHSTVQVKKIFMRTEKERSAERRSALKILMNSVLKLIQPAQHR